MTRKTFEGVDGARLLHIKKLGKHVTVSIEAPGQAQIGITFDPSSIPALALAELEAAGVEARHHSAYENGTPEAMERIAQALTDEVGITEAATAEAKEQAELEAEALELYNAWREANDYDALDSFSDGAPIGTMVEWLAVARRAREMRAEK